MFHSTNIRKKKPTQMINSNNKKQSQYVDWVKNININPLNYTRICKRFEFRLNSWQTREIHPIEFE